MVVYQENSGMLSDELWYDEKPQLTLFPSTELGEHTKRFREHTEHYNTEKVVLAVDVDVCMLEHDVRAGFPDL